MIKEEVIQAVAREVAELAPNYLFIAMDGDGTAKLFTGRPVMIGDTWFTNRPEDRVFVSPSLQGYASSPRHSLFDIQRGGFIVV